MDEINTGCCCYKFTELKSRNPRILFNTTDARKPGETRGARTRKGQPKEGDKESEHINPACNLLLCRMQKEVLEVFNLDRSWK